MKKIFDDIIIEKLNNVEVNLPQDDWETLLAKMPAKPRRVVPLWYYVAAASIVLLIGFGAFVMFFEQSGQKPLVAQTLGNNPPKDKSNANSADDCSATKAIPKVSNAKNSGDNSSVNNSNNDPKILDNLKQSKTSGKGIKLYNKKRNVAVSSAETNESNTTSENDNTPAVDGYKSGIPNDNQKRKPAVDENKSLDDYKRENNTTNQKEDAKQQRRNLKERISMMKNYYAAVLSSLSPLSGKASTNDRSDSFRSTNGYGAVSSPYYSSTKHNIPVSFGLSAGIPLVKDKLYLNTGVKYTYLYSSTATRSNITHDMVSFEEQRLHYIGIPIALSYQFLQKGRFKAYLGGGVTVEKGIVKNEKFRSYVFDGEGSFYSRNKQIDGLMVSLNAHAGVAYRLVRELDIYIEPEFSWYIPNVKHPQPTSKITENPLTVNVAGGLRWNF